MTNPANVVTVASGQVGYEETGGHGHDGNITKFWAELNPHLQGQPWCAGFVSWVFKHAGAPLPAIDQSWGYSYCPNAVTWARKHGELVSVKDATAGDIVFFNWKGGSLAEHTGIVVSNDGSNLHTIEGNTEPTNNGDQSNGGGVYRKVRPYSTVVAVWRVIQRPASADVHAAPKPNPFPVPTVQFTKGCSNDTAKSGDPKNPNNTKVHFIQWAVGVPCDGQFGDDTLAGVKHFQAYHTDPQTGKPLTQDGVVGPATLRAAKTVKH